MGGGAGPVQGPRLLVRYRPPLAARAVARRAVRLAITGAPRAEHDGQRQRNQRAFHPCPTSEATSILDHAALCPHPANEGFLGTGPILLAGACSTRTSAGLAQPRCLTLWSRTTWVTRASNSAGPISPRT